MLVKLVLIGLFVVPAVLLVIFSFLRKMNSAEKSWYYCFLSTGLTPLRMLKIGPFKQSKITIEGAMRYAEKKTKMNDWGDRDFVDSYSTMMNLPAHKKLVYHNLGFIMGRLELNMSMVRRLRVIDFLKQAPQVRAIPFNSPVFVLGLPRTGTTFLHRLLSLDTQVRAPLLWELLAPVPSEKLKSPASASLSEFSADADKRKNYIRKLIDSRKSAGDNSLEHIHEIGYDLPEECIMSLSDEMPVLLQHFYTDYLEIDTFFKVVNTERVVKAYQWYRTVLQILNYQIGERDGSKRWMLKCPIHMFYPKEIAKAFPEAKLIWTHRHPVSAVPSMCSLLKSVHQVYYETNTRDDAALGRRVADLSGHMLEKTPKDIEESGLDHANVVYDDLIKDPISVVRSVYKQLGWAFTPEYEAKLNSFIADDKMKREQIKKKNQSSGATLHSYTPEEFDLTAKELTSGKFATYADKHKVPLPKTAAH